jgi:predicted lipoprotein with Yx(FWY)xxD motif
MRSIRLSIGLTLGVLPVLLLAACGGTTGSTPSGAASSASSSPLIHTASIMVAGKSKTALTTVQGRTLYYFTPDTATSTACTGGCANTWPPLLAGSSSPTSDPALPGQLSVLSGPNGNQVVYNGHPLYSFSKDSAAGDANGQGIAGKWFVATPDLAAATTASASANPGYAPVY